MLSVAAETGWSEQTIMFMPMAKLAQFQHCIMRRNGARTVWSNDVDEPDNGGSRDLATRLATLREQWLGTVDSDPDA